MEEAGKGHSQDALDQPRNETLSGRHCKGNLVLLLLKVKGSWKMARKERKEAVMV